MPDRISKDWYQEDRRKRMYPDDGMKDVPYGQVRISGNKGGNVLISQQEDPRIHPDPIERGSVTFNFEEENTNKGYNEKVDDVKVAFEKAIEQMKKNYKDFYSDKPATDLFANESFGCIARENLGYGITIKGFRMNSTVKIGISGDDMVRINIPFQELDSLKNDFDSTLEGFKV